jgi:hypothetical protein
MRVVAAFDLAYTPPVYVCWVAVLLVARHDAAFASDALRHVEVEPVLFARAKWTPRNQRRSPTLDLNQA